jgi:2-oxoglutarate ferredoxin oxidoreductase subunit delta
MTTIDQPTGEASVLTRGHVVIDTEACKGCDLCIDACPPGVLVMTTHVVNDRGYRFPLLLPGCTGCKACSQICPDFVFQVYKLATPISVLLDAPTSTGTDTDDAH